MLRSFGLPLVIVVAALTVSLGAQAGRGRGGPTVELPDGPGKEAVTATCGSCHALNSITGSAGYTQGGWRDLIATMVALPEAQAGTVTPVSGRSLSAEDRSGADPRDWPEHDHVP
jgi:hypothetical protein